MKLRKPCEHDRYEEHPDPDVEYYRICPGGAFLSEEDAPDEAGKVISRGTVLREVADIMEKRLGLPLHLCQSTAGRILNLIDRWAPALYSDHWKEVAQSDRGGNDG